MRPSARRSATCRTLCNNGYEPELPPLEPVTLPVAAVGRLDDGRGHRRRTCVVGDEWVAPGSLKNFSHCRCPRKLVELPGVNTPYLCSRSRRRITTLLPSTEIRTEREILALTSGRTFVAVAVQIDLGNFLAGLRVENDQARGTRQAIMSRRFASAWRASLLRRAGARNAQRAGWVAPRAGQS
jgi:hypothetical protein